jgi:hypothetical protein
MTPDRLEELVAAYGADPQRWPADERSAALALLERVPLLHVELDRMAGLDAVLDRWPSPAPRLDAESLTARITATRQARPEVLAKRRFRWPSLAWPNAAGLAAAALAGFLVGWSGLDSDLLSGAQADNIDRQVMASVIEDATW